MTEQKKAILCINPLKKCLRSSNIASMMVTKYRLTSEAKEDLRRIYVYGYKEFGEKKVVERYKQRLKDKN